jgi:hypothetical protein
MTKYVLPSLQFRFLEKAIFSYAIKPFVSRKAVEEVSKYQSDDVNTLLMLIEKYLK